MKLLKDYTKIECNSENDYELFQKLQDISSNKNIITIPEMAVEEKERFAIVRCLENGELWTQQYVGILEIDGETVFIGSRFDDKEEYWFTHYIISRAMGMKASVFPQMRPQIGFNYILEELLAIAFVSQIGKAYRKGLYRRYRTYECNDSKIKGKIDIERHIRKNLLFNGNIAYSYRELTADNNINKIILTAFSYLEKRHPQMLQGLLKHQKSTKDCIKQLKNVLEPASKQEIQKLLQRERKKITHPLYHDWELVRKTAIMILRHMGVQMAAEDNRECSGVLVNMNKIWESYLESIIKEHIPGNYEITTQEEKGYLLSGTNEKPLRVAKPDYCVYTNENELEMILDAKYKNQWEAIVSKRNPDWTEPREDIFQIISYMHLYQCKRSGVICPCSNPEKNVEPVTCKISKELKDESLTIFPLKISSMQEMKEEEKKLVGEIFNKMKGQ